jgi:hypothetical protein
LVYRQGSGNHQSNHNQIEKDSPEDAGFSERSYGEDEDDEGDGHKGKAQIAGPELAQVQVMNTDAGLPGFAHHAEL